MGPGLAAPTARGQDQYRILYGLTVPGVAGGTAASVPRCDQWRSFHILMCDWLAERMDVLPMASARVYYETSGWRVETPYGD